MSYKPMYKDFIKPDIGLNSTQTNRKLTSRTAYFLENIVDGSIEKVSKETAEKLLENTRYTLNDYVDLTRHNSVCDSPMDNKNNRINKEKSNDEAHVKSLRKLKALEYLELRENKLKKYCVPLQKLEEYYIKSKSKDLNDNEISHILNIEKKVKNSENPKIKNLSFSNLQKIYYFKCLLEYIIFPLGNKKDYFEGVLRYILNTLSITQKQEESLKKYM